MSKSIYLENIQNILDKHYQNALSQKTDQLEKRGLLEEDNELLEKQKKGKKIFDEFKSIEKVKNGIQEQNGKINFFRYYIYFIYFVGLGCSAAIPIILVAFLTPYLPSIAIILKTLCTTLIASFGLPLLVPAIITMFCLTVALPVLINFWRKNSNNKLSRKYKETKGEIDNESRKLEEKLNEKLLELKQTPLELNKEVVKNIEALKAKEMEKLLDTLLDTAETSQEEKKTLGDIFSFLQGAKDRAIIKRLEQALTGVDIPSKKPLPVETAKALYLISSRLYEVEQIHSGQELLIYFTTINPATVNINLSKLADDHDISKENLLRNLELIHKLRGKSFDDRSVESDQVDGQVDGLKSDQVDGSNFLERETKKNERETEPTIYHDEEFRKKLNRLRQEITPNNTATSMEARGLPTLPHAKPNGNLASNESEPSLFRKSESCNDLSNTSSTNKSEPSLFRKYKSCSDLSNTSSTCSSLNLK